MRMQPFQQYDDVAVSNLKTLLEIARAGESLPLRAVNIRALHSGGYTSPFKGRGMEFDETRMYQPGDDIRNLDWKVTARTGKTHTKLFREERERPVLLWLDLRQPMFFATHGVYKSVAAATASSLLAWGAVTNRDRIGGLIFSEHTHHELKPAGGKTAALRFLQTLCAQPQWHTQPEPADIPAEESAKNALLRLRNVTRPGSLIFLLSDFRGFTSELEKHVASIARHNDIVLLHIFDPLEAELPPPGRYKLRSGNREISIDTADKQIRARYHQRFAQHQQYLRTLCGRYKMFYLACRSDDNPVTILQTGLGLKNR
ncbi:MAG TPA: DUF58 domain-containing protein [Gammaproteobacteria bacterium]